MRTLIVRHILIVTGLLIHVGVPAQMRFTENKGQWDSRALYRTHTEGAYVFYEHDRFTYLLYDAVALSLQHGHPNPPAVVNHHAFSMRFAGSSARLVSAESPSSDYENYLIGNNPAYWATYVRHYQKVNYRDLYPGIDAQVYTSMDHLKYDLLVRPGGKPSDIRIVCEHADSIWLHNGELYIATSVGVMTEQAPLAYQQKDGYDEVVPCAFTLKGNEVGFQFPEGYDRSRELVIDPVLVFSTFTGSTADNFGFTATYDDAGNAYGGGVVFANGQYPVSAGAFQVAFSGGGASAPTDIGITKYNPTGTALIYSTYIGGSASSDAPHSLITDAQGNLYVLGTTGSSNFPMLATSFDPVFSGGAAISPAGSGLSYASGSDILVFKLNATGTALLGSTFIGGSMNDGLNNPTGLKYFYGDSFRGEIGLDATGNVYCVSTTESTTDFPVTVGAPQSAFGGGTNDAVVFKLNNDLSALLWSTYWGGSNNDAGFGLQFNSAGDIYITGGTQSTNLPTSPGVIRPTFGGVRDGYLARFNGTTGALMACTYVGTAQHDQVYFVQLDLNDDVYVLGVTEGTYPVTAGVYSNPGSWQFLHKMSGDFTATSWSTVVGSSTNVSNFSPTAFLVDNCGSLYLSGWGGSVNGLNPPMSNTTGCPVTMDATQLNTDGSDFYLMVMDQNATTLNYATFLGGGVNEHVDGGTSRFDKSGRIYQSVCAGCGGSSAFPTTPGAYSNTNNSFNCNMALFKYDLRILQPTADFVVDTVNCGIPSVVPFQNTSTGAQGYVWDFGDGSPQLSGFNVIHNYFAPGTYDVTLVAIDPFDCFINDTAMYPVTIPAPPLVNIVAPDSVCPGEDVALQAIGQPQYVYDWTCNLTLTSTTNPNTSVLNVTVPMIASISVTDTTGCVATDTALVWVKPGFSVLASFTADYDTCAVPEDVLFTNTSSGSNQQVWDFGDGGASQLFSPTHTYSAAGTYDISLIAIDSASCNIADTAYANVLLVAPPVISTIDPGPFCPGGSVQLGVTGQPQYTFVWFPGNSLDNPNSPTPTANPSQTTQYVVIATDTTGCTTSDSTLVTVFDVPFISAGTDLFLTVGTNGVLNAVMPDSVQSIVWSPSAGLSCDTCPNPIASPQNLTTYLLTVTDTNGCVYTDEVVVSVESSIYVPNAFSPNGDLMNDEFKAIARGVSEFRMFVFNRWGEVIWQTDDPEQTWDGTYRGFRSPSDVYVWKIRYVAQEEPGIYRQLVGHVTLVR
jgi:gliding motility-associated-like protein